MRAFKLALAFAVGCRASLPEPAEPLARTPDAPFRARPPDPLPDAPEVRLPRVESEQLANGLTVVVASRPESRSTSVELVVRGAGFEASPEAAGGLATVLALAEATEVRVRADAEREAAYIGIDTDEAGLDFAVRSLADAILRPKIERETVAVVRDHLARRFQRDRWVNVIQAIAYRQLYLEPPVLPVAKSVSEFAVTEQTVSEFREGRYVPENAALIIAGPQPLEQAVTLAGRHFGTWKRGAAGAPPSHQGLPPLTQSDGPRLMAAFDSRGELARALVILPAPPAAYPGFPEYALADVLLGGSLTSRGNAALRLHDAKSYGVHSSIEQRRTGSELQLAFAVEQDDFIESLERILVEIERLRREPVSAEELHAAKSTWLARLSSRLVTSSETVALLRKEFALGRDPSAFAGLADRVRRVIPAGLQQVARREFTRDRMQVVVFADRSKFEAALRHVGPAWWR